MLPRLSTNDPTHENQYQKEYESEVKLKILFHHPVVNDTSLTTPQTWLPEPTLSKAEREKAIKLLLDSQKETLEAVSKLSDAQWNYKPSPEKWSSVKDSRAHLPS